jgi:hypothetical protein
MLEKLEALTPDSFYSSLAGSILGINAELE